MKTPRAWLIGSRSDCDLIVQSPLVSGHHCRLSETAKGFVLQDLDSTNGVYVNSERIQNSALVSATDAIALAERIPVPWPVGLPRGAVCVVRRLGRFADNDLVVDHPSVSGYHARLVVLKGEATLEDLGSTNGTFVGFPPRQIQRASLHAGDRVRLGAAAVDLAKLLNGVAVSPPPANSPTQPPQVQPPQGNRVLLLGRHEPCDRVLDHPLISRRHAQLIEANGRWAVADLGSTNGTFVNGARVQGRREVRPGDSLTFGPFNLELTAENDWRVRDERGAVAIEAQNLGVQIGQKALLHDVTLTILPGEFVALMGASGAGKTTLLSALNGNLRPATGHALLNGLDIYENYDLFRAGIGYVPQDDIIHRELTVMQAMYYTARLRLPSDFDDAEIEQRVRRVLAQLGLQGSEHVRIGSPEKKGISGGQRKRVNLALELLTEPAVLFLDEPTSGLSSEDTLVVMRLLRRLADNGKTILLTIHQPSLEAYRLLTHLALLAKDPAFGAGTLIYYGPAYPDAIKFFNPDGVPNLPPGALPSPDEVLRGFGRRDVKEWQARFEQSTYRQKYVTGRRGTRTQPTPASQPEPPRRDLIAQWLTLARRCLQIKLADRMSTAILVIQAPVVALLIVLIFGKEASEQVTADNWSGVARSTSVTVFLMGLSAFWFGCSNTVREIVGEWAIYRRERMVNLSIPAYVASKLTVLGALSMFQCAVLLAAVYWGCAYSASWPALYLLLVLVSAVGLGAGLLLSSVARTSEVAVGLLPIVLIPVVVLGGMMQPIHKMHAAMQTVSNAIPARWAFEGMVGLEADRRPLGPLPEILVATGDPDDEEDDAPDMAQQSFPHEDRHAPATSVAVLTAMLAVLLAAVCVVLRLRDLH